MSEEQNNIDQNGIQQTEGMDTQESQGGEGTENEDERKIFVGGLGWDTTQKELQEYMENFGAVSSCALKTDMETRKSRGFGFVVFKDASSIDKVLAQSEHKIKDRKIDPKRANPRGDRESKENKKKIFVGKVDPSTTEDTLRTYFEQFGTVEKVELPFDKMKDMRRNFVFIEFDKEETVTKILSQENHKIGDEEVAGITEVVVVAGATREAGATRAIIKVMEVTIREVMAVATTRAITKDTTMDMIRVATDMGAMVGDGEAMIRVVMAGTAVMEMDMVEDMITVAGVAMISQVSKWAIMVKPRKVDEVVGDIGHTDLNKRFLGDITSAVNTNHHHSDYHEVIMT